MKRIACSGIGLALSVGLLGLSAFAQNQSQPGTSSESSLGDYARQVRKAPASKQRVFDNDNLPKDTKLSIIGPAPAAEGAPAENSSEAKPAESTNAAPAAGETKAAPAAEPKASDSKTGDAKAPADAKAATDDEAGKEAAKQAAIKRWEDKLTAQKEQIDLLTRELNVLQREYQIRAAAMYGDVGNRMRNSGDWDKQDAEYKQQIADKQKALDDAKQKLDDLQEDARKDGVPASARE